MDVLSQILQTVRLRGSLYFRTEFDPPWGVRVPPYRNVARFHLVIRGECWVRIPGADKSVLLGPGDLVVIPHGAEHVLSDARDSPAVAVDEVVRNAGFTGDGALVYGGLSSGRATNLVCGHFQFDEEAIHPVLQALPPYIHVRGSDSLNYTWLDNAMRFIGLEAWSGRAGSDAIVHRLSEIVFIQVVRAYLDQAGERAPGLAAIADPQISRALSLIHTTPRARLTLELLAREAAMSRTQFAQRFRELMGMTPMDYLTFWRMQLARHRLADGAGNIVEVAADTGYASEAAFSRAFQKTFGMNPSAYRRRARA
ncbi:MAG: cupin domain-containing protein [Dongiaceae bacterium]